MAESTELKVIVSMVDQFTGAMNKTADKLKDFSDGALKVGAAFTATGTVITGLAVKSVTDFSDMGDAIEKMATRTGLGAESVSALRVAADASGTSIETVENSIKKMQMNMQVAEDGTLSMATALSGFGIALSDNFIDLDPAAQFEELAKQIGSLPDETDRTNAAIAAFGKSGAELIPMFEDGSFSMDQWKTKAGEMGVLMSDDTAASAAELNDALGYLKGTISGLWMEVGEKLAPTFTSLADKIQPIIAKLTAWMDANPKLVEKLELAALAVGALMLAIGPLLVALGVLPTLITGVSTALGLFTGPVGWVVLAITALIAIGVLLYKNWETIKEKIDDVKNKINEFLNQHPEVMAALEQAKEIIKKVADIIQEQFKKAWDDLMKAIEPHLPELQKLALLLGGALLVALGVVAVSIGTIVLVLGALLLIGIKVITWILDLKTKFDEFIDKTLNAIPGAIENIKNAFINTFTGLKDTVQYYFNEVVGVVTNAVDNMINKILEIPTKLKDSFSSAVSSVSSTLSNLSMPDIPFFASGVHDFQGGLAVVGEQGPELVNLPKGSDVIPNSSLSGLGGGETENNYDMSKQFDITIVNQGSTQDQVSQLRVMLQTL